ncbi:phage tail tape measure protein [Brevibacillus reuszeri]|uniref:phage tail tape measure protein n=1 Tax=Brevibacillus reuszeri TaxID=54915 RepID=UPI00366A9990
MAETIRGINVVIGAETTGLSNALSDVNKKSKSIQSELKQVETLLKLDPTNTELVAQKQKLLGDAIANTEEKLSRLRTAQQQVNEQFARGEISEGQYRAFQRELAKTEQELQSFENRLRQTGEQVKSFADKANEAGNKLKESGEKISSAGEKMSVGLTAPLAAVGIVAGKMAADVDAATGKVQARLGLTAEEAEKLSAAALRIWKDGFGNSLEEVNTALAQTGQNIQGLDDITLEQLTQSALTLQEVFDADVNETTRTASVLMKNFGLDGQAAMDLMTLGFQKGGDFSGELLDTLREYAPQFKAMGISAEDAMGMLIKGTENGAFNLDKVGDAIKEFNIRIKDGSDGTAEALAMLFAPEGIEEFTQSLMTGSKSSAEYMQLLQKVSKETADQLVSDLQSGGKKSEDAYLALQTIMGEGNQILSGLSDGSLKGQDALVKVIQKLKEIQDPILQNTIGVALFGTQWEDLEKDVVLALDGGIGALGEFEGATDKARQAAQNNFSTELKKVWRELQADLIPLGKTMLELAQNILPPFIAAITNLANWFNGLPPAAQATIVVIAGIAAAIGPLLLIVGSLISSVGNVILVFTQVSQAISSAGGMMTLLKVAFTTLTGPVGIAIAAITALAVAAYLIYDNWEPIKEFFITLWETIKSTTETAWEGIKQFFSATWEWIQNFFAEWGTVILAIIAPFIGVPLLIAEHWDEIKVYLSELWESVKQTATEAWNLIATAIMEFVTPLVEGITAGFNTMRDGLTQIWEGIKLYFGAVWDIIKTIFGGAILLIYDLVTGNFTQLSADAQMIWNALKDAFGRIWEAIKMVFSGALDVIKGYLTIVWGTIKTVTESVWNGMKTFFTTLWETMKKLTQTAVDTMKKSIVTSWEAIKKFFTETWDKIKWLFTDGLENAKKSVVNGMLDMKSNFFSYMGEIVDGVKGFAKDFVKAGEDFVRSLWEGIKSKTDWLYNQIKGFVSGLMDSIRGSIGGGGGRGNVSGDSNMTGAGGAPSGGAAKAASIPGLKDGGTVTKSGWTWVGENGIELLKLPQGSQVIPNYDLPNIGSPSPTINLSLNLNGPVFGIDDLQNQIKQIMKSDALPILTKQLRQSARARG